jgi:hypothetical protein
MEFAAPASDEPTAPGFGPWENPERRRRAAAASVAVVLAAMMMDALWSVIGMITVGGVVAVPNESWFDTYDSVTTGLFLVYLALFAISGLLFIRWQRLAIRNTAFLGCERPDPSTGAATAGWFIPIANLFLPLLSFRQISRWSRPPDAPNRESLLTVWWLGWIVTNLSFSVIGILHATANGATPWVTARGVDAAATLLQIAVGVLAIKVVNTLSRDQTAKAEALGRS